MHASTRRAALAASTAFTFVVIFMVFVGEGSFPSPVVWIFKALGAIALIVQAGLVIGEFGRDGFRSAVERQFFQGSQDANFVLDGPRIVDCNDATVKILRAKSREQVMQLTPADFSPEFQPDGRPSGEKAMELIGQAIKSGSNRFEWMHARLDGTPLPASVTLIAVTILGKSYLMVYIHDISALNEARERERKASSERHQMLERLATSFESRVKGIVTAVVASVGQLQTNAKDLARSVGESTHGLTSVSSASNDASGGIEIVASASSELTSSIQEISRRVSESASITRQAAEEAQVTNTTIQGLSDAVNKIGEIVGLINAIAAQTNLLALNATIESARAGEAGKGFAVVANEVKHLAGQTARATDDISQQINAIQAQTRQAVEAIRHVGATIHQVDEMAAAIASAVDQQRAATSEIARNVDTAADGTRQVALSLGNVAKSAQQTEALAQQVEDRAHALSDGSRNLEVEVQGFLSEVRNG